MGSGVPISLVMHAVPLRAAPDVRGAPLLARLAGSPTVGANHYTPEFTKTIIPLENATEIHWTIPEKINWANENPYEHATEESNSVGTCLWKSFGKCH